MNVVILILHERLYGGIPSYVYVIFLLPFLILVCWVRSFKLLAVLSLAGQIMMLTGLSIIMVFAMISAVENTPPIKAINVVGIPVYFGMVRIFLRQKKSFKKQNNLHDIEFRLYLHMRALD